MLLFFDLNRGRLVSTPGSGDSISSLEFKRGDTLPVTIRFSRGLDIVELPAGSTGIIAIKPIGLYDVAPLASSVNWVKSGTDSSTYYDFVLNLSTADLNAALGVGGAADVSFLPVNFELQFVVDGNVTSSQTVSSIVHNDVVRDTDLTPSSLPTLDSWLAAQLGRNYIPNTEKGITAGKIPVLGISGKLDPSLLPSLALTTTAVVSNAAARLALSIENSAGKIIVEADTGKSYGIISGGNPSLAIDWVQFGDRDVSISDVSGLQSSLVSLQAAAATDATTKASNAQAAAISAAATDATNKTSGKANLTGGNTFTGPQPNTGPVSSSAALSTDPTQFPNQGQVFGRQIANNIAYVSPTFGSDALGTVGAITRPFATLNAAHSSAATRIVVLEDTSFGGFSRTKPLDIILTNGAFLTCTSQVAIGTNLISVVGIGSFIQNTSLYDGNQATSVFINISGDITLGTGAGALCSANAGNTARIGCRRFFSNSTNGVSALGSSGSASATVYIQPGVKFIGTGSPLFAAGGPTSNPKIIFGEGCMIWHTGTSIFGNAGSEGGVYAPNILRGGTATLQSVSNVVIAGTITAPAWLTEAIVRL